MRFFFLIFLLAWCGQALAQTVPDAPTAVVATAGNAQATVSFTAPANNGGSAITSYTVTATPAAGQDLQVSTTATSHIVIGLTNGTSYLFTVTADNAVGSSLGADSNSVTPVTVPDPPTAVTATPGHSLAIVSFSAPLADGGSPILSYRATCGNATAVGATSPITVTGLVDGTAYACTVKASNALGASLASSAAAATPLITVPGAPTIVSAALSNGQATIVFTAPSSNGGSAITAYTATCGATLTGTATASPVTVTGLSGGGTYTCTLTATNAVGISADSNAVTLGLATVPGAPTSAAVTAGNTQASVRFTAPANNGGSPITAYTATCGAFIGTAAASPVVVTGLSNGSTYACSVTATNGVGTGLASNSVNVTLGNVPGAPRATGATAGNGQASVRFSAPSSNGGSAITAYTATCGSATGSGTASPVVVRGLNNGSTYSCSVVATNLYGTGAVSNAVSVALTVASNQSISFGAPVPSRQAIGSFTINPLATASSGLAVAYSSTTPTVCTVSGTTVRALAAGTCVISAGQAGNTTVAAAAAVTQSITIVSASVPDAPTLGSAVAGVGSATLNFTGPAYTGGSTITSYLATCTANGQTSRVGFGNNNTSAIVVSGLTGNVPYMCSVTANNSQGSSAASTALAVTPSAAPVIGTAASPLSGLWWNESEPGWGISVSQHDRMIFATWYTYGASGVGTWYAMPSCPVANNACSGDIYAVSGGRSFVAPWPGAAVVATKVGSGTLSFTDLNNGVFSFTINGQQGSKALGREIFATGSSAPYPDFTDLWWNPNESGWGVAITQEYGIIFATLFGYDSLGNPAWYVASRCLVTAYGCSGELYQVNGGTAPTSPWNGSRMMVTQAGTLSLTFTDAGNGTMNYVINGVPGSKSITRQQF